MTERPPVFGPGAFDVSAMKRAIHLHGRRRGDFVSSASERAAHELVVGSAGMRIGLGMATGRMYMELDTECEDEMRCYHAAMGWPWPLPVPTEEEVARDNYEVGGFYAERDRYRAEVYGLGPSHATISGDKELGL